MARQHRGQALAEDSCVNVLYVSADLGGCRFYRCVLPGMELHRAGHVVCVTEDIAITASGEIRAAALERVSGEGFVGRTADIGFDVVVMQRFMASSAAGIVQRAHASGQVVINDVDDDFWSIPPSHPAYRSVIASRNPDSNRAHYTRALQGSDAVTVSTPYLADKLSDLGPPIRVVPNAIDPERYEPHMVRDTTSPTFGWVGALSYRDPGDVEILRGCLGPFLLSHPRCRFVHVGARSEDPGTTADVLDLPAEQVEVRPFCHIADLPQAMNGIDVALAPLEDTPFNHAKSAIKALEAAAAHIPLIASDMPEYRSLGYGRLCVTDQEWADALEAMCDPTERARVADHASVVVSRHDIRRRWTDWLDVYAALVPSHAGNASGDAQARTYTVPDVR